MPVEIKPGTGAPIVISPERKPNIDEPGRNVTIQFKNDGSNQTILGDGNINAFGFTDLNLAGNQNADNITALIPKDFKSRADNTKPTQLKIGAEDTFRIKSESGQYQMSVKPLGKDSTVRQFDFDGDGKVDLEVYQQTNNSGAVSGAMMKAFSGSVEAAVAKPDTPSNPEAPKPISPTQNKDVNNAMMKGFTGSVKAAVTKPDTPLNPPLNPGAGPNNGNEVGLGTVWSKLKEIQPK